MMATYLFGTGGGHVPGRIARKARLAAEPCGAKLVVWKNKRNVPGYWFAIPALDEERDRRTARTVCAAVEEATGLEVTGLGSCPQCGMMFLGPRALRYVDTTPWGGEHAVCVSEARCEDRRAIRLASKRAARST